MLPQIFPPYNIFFGRVAQAVEQGTENPCVGGSTPSPAIKLKKLVLPVRGMTCASCARTVENVLKNKKGIYEVRVDFSSGRAMAEVEDSEGLIEASKELRDFGYVISFEDAVIKIHNMDYANIKKLSESVEALEGVVKVDVAENRLFVKYSPVQVSIDRILKIVKGFGYECEVEGVSKFEKRGLKLFHRFILSLIPTVLVMLGHYLGVKPFNNLLLQGILASFVVIFCGFPILKSGVMGFIRWNLNMNSLISLGVLTALLSGHFEPASIIITLILFGKSLEEKIRERAYREIGELIENVPRFANVERDGKIERIYTGELSEGEIVVVKTGERVPVDGSVVYGSGEVSMAALTGESVPVSVSEGDKVYAGSVLVSGYLKVRVENVGEDTFVGKLKEVVLKANEEKNRIQRLADKISAHFTLLVLIIASITFISWLFFGSFDKALLSAIAVVVIACPCALGIATPVAISVMVGRSTKKGLLVKHPEVFERAKDIKAVCFDKTGTLTVGRPRVKKFVGNGDILKYASALASKSNHPYSKAVYEYCGSSDLKVDDVKEYPGMGIEGIIEGKRVRLGKGKFVGKEGEGLWVGVDGIYGKFLIEDGIKDAAFNAVKELKSMGIKVFIISGDSESNTKKVADILNVDGYFANVLPDEKVEKVEYIKRNFGKVAFVGDGINDAPVLSKADIGIAVGSASDIAALAGDIVILRGDIDRVPEILHLTRKTYRRIAQNLLWAFLYNTLLIPVAAFGYVPPELSAAAMSLSSITVVLNSLRP